MQTNYSINSRALKRLVGVGARGLTIRVLDWFLDNADENGQIIGTTQSMFESFNKGLQRGDKLFRGTASINQSIIFLRKAGIISVEHRVNKPSIHTLNPEWVRPIR